MHCVILVIPSLRLADKVKFINCTYKLSYIPLPICTVWTLRRRVKRENVNSPGELERVTVGTILQVWKSLGRFCEKKALGKKARQIAAKSPWNRQFSLPPFILNLNDLIYNCTYNNLFIFPAKNESGTPGRRKAPPGSNQFSLLLAVELDQTSNYYSLHRWNGSRTSSNVNPVQLNATPCEAHLGTNHL